MYDDDLKKTGTDIEGGKFLSPLSVWALSFGCAVGWGSFVMPGTTFLPQAGPLGTVLGIVIGALVMLVIGVNYNYLMNKYPDAGGTMIYSIRTFGYDHGFLSAWFLILVYVAIIWANASALTLIARNLFGNVFQFGFHYTLFGYDIYGGEIMLTGLAMIIFGCLCGMYRSVAIWIQVVMAFVLITGICVCYFVLAYNRGGISTPPGFYPEAGNVIRQIGKIVILSPWAYVGFESVSNSTSGFNFSVKKSLKIMIAALICSAVAYSFLAQLAVFRIPEGYINWTSYIKALPSLEGITSLPTFYAASGIFGGKGIVILGMAAMAGIITGLVGNYFAAGRLLCAMAVEGMLPEWFAYRAKNRSPRNALLFLTLVSLPIPLFGRTALGWIVDVNTVGATIAYAYTSAAALVNAKKEKNKAIIYTGVLGLFISTVFFLYFMTFSTGAMSTESYLILIAWSILGFLYFRNIFARDKFRRFGKSTVVWICLLFLIFFTSLVWIRQATNDMTKELVQDISEHYEKMNDTSDPTVVAETEQYIEQLLNRADMLQRRNSIIQMMIIMVSLGIMFSVYSMISKRGRQMEMEKIKAEESSRSKSIFLSNMSHDIRTPMNAIIGYVNMVQRDGDDPKKVKEYIDKIKTSSLHLLALINDVLEMSRIESGRMDLEPIPMDLIRVMDDLKDMFSTQMESKRISFTMDVSKVGHSRVYCDKNRLNRVLLNLLSNAWKFTPEGGSVNVTLSQTGESAGEGEGSFGTKMYGDYELRVEDTGMGMSKEFAAKVFEAFERERNEVVNDIQGTGLGMAITKSIVDLMGGQITVDSTEGKGTEFTIKLRLEYASDETPDSEVLPGETEESHEFDFTNKRVLLVEDMDINRQLASMILTRLGFQVETAVNGREAVDKLIISTPGYYDLVLMDVQMPVLNGYDATKEIRAFEDRELAQVPVIAMTANAFSEDVKAAFDAGMNAHVAKPIDVDVLKKVLADVLSAKQKEN